MTGPLLTPGSPDACAVAAIMSNRRLVELDPCADPLQTALLAARFLLTMNPLADVAFAADTVSLRGRLAGQLRTRARRLTGRPGLVVMQGPRVMPLEDSPAKPVRVISPDQTFGAFKADLLIVHAGSFTRDDLHLHHFDAFTQILLTGPVSDATWRSCAAVTRIEPLRPPRWGQIPLEVLLAGAPE